MTVLSLGNKTGLNAFTVRHAGLRTNFQAANRRMIPAYRYARVLDTSEGGHGGMRSVRSSLQRTDQDVVPLEADATPSELPLELVPAECPGVFIEQPLERWSPRDLIVGVFRLVRWTRLATS
jgi:hypothetical protein